LLSVESCRWASENPARGGEAALLAMSRKMSDRQFWLVVTVAILVLIVVGLVVVAMKNGEIHRNGIRTLMIDDGAIL
jgi:hypothetical protein